MITNRSRKPSLAGRVAWTMGLIVCGGCLACNPGAKPPAAGEAGINKPANKDATKAAATPTIVAGPTTVARFSDTMTFNAGAGNSIKLTLEGNVTSSSIANPAPGQSLTLLLCQDAIGSRTMTWPANLKLSGGAFPLTKTANKCDALTAVYDGNDWYEIARATDE